ncbi:MAG: hypothetical protein AB1656_04985 [Candidatus Omnitrophota bacterium]
MKRAFHQGIEFEVPEDQELMTFEINGHQCRVIIKYPLTSKGIFTMTNPMNVQPWFQILRYGRWENADANDAALIAVEAVRRLAMERAQAGNLLRPKPVSEFAEVS